MTTELGNYAILVVGVEQDNCLQHKYKRSSGLESSEYRTN